MKRIFIVDTYPAGPREIQILERCIDSIKNLGYDIMVVTHYPVELELAKKVNYVVYDNNNEFLPEEYTPYYWVDSPSFKIKVFNAGHTLPICRNVSNGIHLASSLKYEEFIFMENDIIFDSEDLNMLHEMLNSMVEQNKKMLYFKPHDYFDCNGSRVYETLMFAGNPDYFLNIFKPPLNLEDWLSKPMGYTLELSFYEQFCKYENDFYIVEDHSSRIFTKSLVNVFRYGLFNCEVLYNIASENEPVFFVVNDLIENTGKYVELYINGVLSADKLLFKKQYWFNAYPMDGRILEIKVFDDQERSSLFINKIFVLTPENNTKFKKKGVFITK